MSTFPDSNSPERMHIADQATIDVILKYVNERLVLPEAPVDGLGNREEMKARPRGINWVLDPGIPQRCSGSTRSTSG